MSVAHCPSCGLELPRTGSIADPGRLRASSECLELYGEIVSRVMTDPVSLGHWHQTCVDSYAAQHAGPQTPPITVFFALNTLYLVLEHELTGHQGRDAHGFLASRFGAEHWPRLDAPARRGEVTVLDVALAGTTDELATGIQAWGQSVWNAWSHAQDQVRSSTDELLRDWRPRTG